MIENGCFCYSYIKNKFPIIAAISLTSSIVLSLKWYSNDAKTMAGNESNFQRR